MYDPPPTLTDPSTRIGPSTRMKDEFDPIARLENDTDAPATGFTVTNPDRAADSVTAPYEPALRNTVDPLAADCTADCNALAEPTVDPDPPLAHAAVVLLNPAERAERFPAASYASMANVYAVLQVRPLNV